MGIDERKSSRVRVRSTGRPYKLVKRDGSRCAEFWKLPNGQYDLRVVSPFYTAQQAEAQRLGCKIADMRPVCAGKEQADRRIRDIAKAHPHKIPTAT